MGKMVMGFYGPPAFATRGRNTEEAWHALLDHCRAKRAEMLQGIRWNIRALANALDLPRNEDPETTVRHIRKALTVKPLSSLHSSISFISLLESIERFNATWQAYIAKLDLTDVNRELEKYNEYYVLEKESVVGSEQIARQGFQPKQPVAVTDIAREFPPLDDLKPLQITRSVDYAMALGLPIPHPILMFWSCLTIVSSTESIWVFVGWVFLNLVLAGSLVILVRRYRSLKYEVSKLEAQVHGEPLLPPRFLSWLFPHTGMIVFALFALWIHAGSLAQVTYSEIANISSLTLILISLGLVVGAAVVSFRMMGLIDRHVQLEAVASQNLSY